jgi:hypothetical protein
MQVRIRGVAAIVTLTLAVVAAPAPMTPVAASAAAPLAPLPSGNHLPPATEGQVDNDARFRAALGLPSSKSYVKQMFDDARAGRITVTTDQGAIMTPEEAELVQARTSAVDQVTDIADEYFKARRDIYAGMWIDQAAGTVGIGVVRDAATHRANLAVLIGDTTARWSVADMHLSLDELVTVQANVDAMYGELARQTVDVSSTSIDEEEGTVHVGVTSDKTAATNVLRSSFPDAPLVIEEEPPYVLVGIDGPDSPPFRGGQRISYSMNGRDWHECTSAFVGYQVERLDAAIFQYSYFLITAGHCEQDKAGNGSYGALWNQVTMVIGTSDYNTFKNGTPADGMVIGIQSYAASNDIAINPGEYREVHCMMTNSVKQGQVEITSGATTGGYRSGHLLRTNATVNSHDQTGKVTRMVRQHVTDLAAIPGDSGASVFGTRECKYRAQGVLSTASQSGPHRATYSPIASVTKALALAGVVVS